MNPRDQVIVKRTGSGFASKVWHVTEDCPSLTVARRVKSVNYAVAEAAGLRRCKHCGGDV